MNCNIKRGTYSLLKKYTILYAEDEPIIQMNIHQFLQHYFKQIILASDGKEALDLFQEHTPDVVILDIKMPHINGLDVAKEIRKTDKFVPIIMLTAYNDTDKLLQAIELNLTTYLIKPLSKTKLHEMIEKITSSLNKINKNLVYIDNDYFWNKQSQKLYFQNKIISLTSGESRLCELFIEKLHKDVYYEDIMVHVWADKFDEEISIESVKSLLSRLRKKLPKDSLQNIYGKGYKLQ